MKISNNILSLSLFPLSILVRKFEESFILLEIKRIEENCVHEYIGRNAKEGRSDGSRIDRTQPDTESLTVDRINFLKLESTASPSLPDNRSISPVPLLPLRPTVNTAHEYIPFLWMARAKSVTRSPILKCVSRGAS